MLGRGTHDLHLVYERPVACAKVSGASLILLDVVGHF